MTNDKSMSRVKYPNLLNDLDITENDLTTN